MPYVVNKVLSENAYKFFLENLKDKKLMPDPVTSQSAQASSSTATLGTPTLGTPTLGTPTLGTPTLGAPTLGAPTLGAPTLGAPALGTSTSYASIGGSLARQTTPDVRVRRIVELASDLENKEAGQHFVNLSRRHYLMLRYGVSEAQFDTLLQEVYKKAPQQSEFTSRGQQRMALKLHSIEAVEAYLSEEADNSVGIIPIIRCDNDENMLIAAIAAVEWREGLLDIKSNGAMDPEQDKTVYDTAEREFLEELSAFSILPENVMNDIADKAIELNYLQKSEKNDFKQRLLRSQSLSLQLSDDDQQILTKTLKAGNELALKERYQHSFIIQEILFNYESVAQGFEGQLHPQKPSDPIQQLKALLYRACFKQTLYLTLTQVRVTKSQFSKEKIDALMTYISSRVESMINFFGQPFIDSLRKDYRRNTLVITEPELFGPGPRDTHLLLYDLWLKCPTAPALRSYSPKDIKLLCTDIEEAAGVNKYDTYKSKSAKVEAYLKDKKRLPWKQFFSIHERTTLTHTENSKFTAVRLKDYAAYVENSGIVSNMRTSKGHLVQLFSHSKNNLVNAVQVAKPKNTASLLTAAIKPGSAQDLAAKQAGAKKDARVLRDFDKKIKQIFSSLESDDDCKMTPAPTLGATVDQHVSGASSSSSTSTSGTETTGNKLGALPSFS